MIEYVNEVSMTIQEIERVKVEGAALTPEVVMQGLTEVVMMDCVSPKGCVAPRGPSSCDMQGRCVMA